LVLPLRSLDTNRHPQLMSCDNQLLVCWCRRLTERASNYQRLALPVRD
jgi:hypothetical protein